MGSGAGQGGMAGAVPPGGLASMLGQMSPGMGGPMFGQGVFGAPTQSAPPGSMFGGQRAVPNSTPAQVQFDPSMSGRQSAVLNSTPAQVQFDPSMFGGQSAPGQMDAQRQLAMFGGQPGMRVGQTGMLPPQAQGQGQGLQGLMTQFRQAQPGTSMPTTTQSQMATRMSQPAPQTLSRLGGIFGGGGV